MATYCRGFPSSPMKGTIVVSTQYVDRFLARFRISPCQTSPCPMVLYICWKNSEGVVAGIKNAMILANQLLLRVLADGAKLTIRVGYGALVVSHFHNGVLVQSKLLVR